MYIYADAPKKIVQRNIATAVRLYNLALDVYDNGATDAQKRDGSTAAVSNNAFTLTPQIASHIRMQNAQAMVPGKVYAPSDWLAGQSGNHAEKKLIRHDPPHTELGVSREICNGCLNAIVKHMATVHVSDPNGTYQVVHAPTVASIALNGVAPHRIQNGVGLERVAP